VLQEAQFERVGEDRTREVDVRVIAATNRDLKQEVAGQRFREDLYFRLNVFPIEMAPLRQRLEDVPVLAGHFLQRASAKFNIADVHLTQGDIESLQRYDWPGNIRELQNVIERAVIVSQQGRLRLDLPAGEEPIPAEPTAATRGSSLPDPGARILSDAELRQLEKNNLLAALTATGGKIFGTGGAAQLLGLNRRR
jgi:transcriptional regulator with GAF, ATPase, and Fis domain